MVAIDLAAALRSETSREIVREYLGRIVDYAENGLTALKNAKDFFWGEISCCVTSIFAAVFLIPIYGLNGAAVSHILGGLAATVVTGLTLLRGVRSHQSHSCLTISRVGSIADKARGY